jgi:aryl-alcohol dehydrogenase
MTLEAVNCAVLREANGPFAFENASIDPPREREVLVRIVATGVCHTDAAVRARVMPTPLPVVLGHEGAGVVEAVGSQVTKVIPGDHVILSFQSCGACEFCLQGQQATCVGSFPLNFGGCRADGSHALHLHDGGLNDQFFGQSSFATFSIASERNIVKVPKDVPLELLGPLGCGINTGAGAVMNVFRLRVGESLAVFGSGAVGSAAIMAAKASGATTIIAVDLVQSRLDLALELGATHAFDGKASDLIERIREASGGGVHYSLDCTGKAAVVRSAVEVLRNRGVCGMVGAPDPGVQLALDANDVLGFSKSIRGIVEGDSVPDVFIPALIELYRQGRFPFDKLVKFYDFAAIEEAFHDSEQGTTIKPVLRIGKVAA